MARPTSYKRRKILSPSSPKTTTKKGKNDYMRAYMRLRRAELVGKGAEKICQIDLEKALGMDLKKLGRK